jgi:transcriptional regulator with XRE-family HTH domain
MHLKEYLGFRKINMREFSRRAQVSPSHIHNICSGKKNPSLPLAKRIQQLTDGKVTLDDLFSSKAPSRLKDKEEFK